MDEQVPTRQRSLVRMITRFAVLTAVLLPIGLLAPSAAQAATCSQVWGSLARSAGSGSPAPLTNVRAGRHACYDRLVVDLAGPAGGYSVQYVAHVLTEGEGAVVPLRGGARLAIVVRDPAYDVDGHPTYTPANRRELVGVSGWSTFRQLAWAGTFEGQTTIGLGVRARLPFRVFVLAGPGSHSRLVVDVAHHW